jgi:hypothetical protein
MQITEEVHAVLEIVRAVLNTHTDWVLQGQDLMAEIRASPGRAQLQIVVPAAGLLV